MSDSQLQAAAGTVRCGTCMHVFDARLHWHEAPPIRGQTTLGGVALLRREAETDPAWQAPPAAPPRPEPPPAPEDDFEFSDSFLALGGAGSDAGGSSPAASDDRPTGDTSEEWAMALLEQEESAPSAHHKEILDTIAAVAHGRQSGQGMTARPRPALPSNVPDEPQPGTQEVQSAEKWMQTLLGGNATPAQPQPAASASKPFAVAAPDEPNEDYIPEIFRKPKAAGEPAGESARPAAGAPAPRRASHRRGLWLAGSAAAALLLLAQFSWFNSVRLAGNPTLRPAIAQFCAVTGCQLPRQQDPTQIDSSNLLVFKHPTTPGALMLDTVLTNRAVFAQPYPRLRVTFSNFQDKRIAQYVFMPHEYLGDDIAPDALMLPQQPVHLSLALTDPGEQAVNYRIEFLSAP